MLRNTQLAAGERIAGRERGDWYAALVLAGSMVVSDKTFVTDDVLIAERGARIPEIVAGQDGVQLLEHFRTTRAL
jgi:hypothetical protein